MEKLVGELSPVQTLCGELIPPVFGVDVVPLNVNENGQYSAPLGMAYSPVTVNVAGLVPTGTLEISENGQYNVAEYASASVNVSDGLPFAGGVYF